MSTNTEQDPASTLGTYEVGNCKPPKHCQFQKSASGNPKGRPKGSKNAKTIVTEAYHQTVTVFVNGKPKKVPVIHALIARLQAAALQGDLKAMRLALDTYAKYCLMDDASAISGLLAGQTSFELTAEEYDAVAKNKLLDGVD